MPNTTRRRFLGGLAASSLLPAADRKPNVIVILADDLGYADVGFQGARDIPTPNLDKLAASGVRFTNGSVSHPFCSPTRAGLLTGRYQHRFGHENNPVFNRDDERSGLPLTEITIADTMKKAGYVTGLAGKWHLGAAPQFHPMRRGFTEMFGFLGGGHDYYKAELTGLPREYLIPVERDGKPEEIGGYLTGRLSAEADAFVRRHREHPFFLYLAYNAPHTPLQATDSLLARVSHIADEKRRTYAAMICGVDDGVGKLMATLSELGLERDTLVFFLSDNGGPVSVTNSSNYPLRGAKGELWEGGFRVPYVMRWTGTLPAGKTFSHPVSSLDIFPTAAAAAGASMPSDRTIDGVNLLPFVLGKNRKAPHERLFWRWGGGPRWAVREGRYKLVKIDDDAPRLFDLEADASEARDIAAEKPDVAKRLVNAYADWNRQMVPPVFQGPPRPAAKKAK